MKEEMLGENSLSARILWTWDKMSGFFPVWAELCIASLLHRGRAYHPSCALWVCKCYQNALVTGENNASEVDEVMGTFRATSQPCPVAVVHPACLSLWVCSSVPIVSLTSVARKKDTWARYLSPRPKSPKWSVSPRGEVIMGLHNPRFYESRKSE